MRGLQIADIAVLLVYLVTVAGIGFWSSRRIKRSADFFMPRRFGKLMMVMFSFGAGTHSDQAVGVASKSYTSGLSGIWYQWLWLPVTPFYWLIAPVMRRFRAITTADVFEARYDRSVARLFAVVGMLNLSVTIGLMLRGSSEVIAASTGQLLSPQLAIAVMTVIFVLYGVAGGLAAAIITDFIQGILTIVFSFLLLPMVMNAVGGMEGIRSAIADPTKLSLVAPAEIGFFYIAVIAFNGLIGIVTQPHTMGNCGAGKTEMEGRVGFMFGNLTKRICTIPWCLTGLAAIVYFGQIGRVVEPDQVFGAVAGDFLPRILPGVLGIFIAALLASVMSSCDAFMISSSALFTENIYRPLVPDRPPRHYIAIGRIAAVGVVGGGVCFAYWLRGVVEGLEIFWKISAMMGLAFWLGLFWRRTTVAGAWAATLVSFAVWFATSRISIGGLVWDFDAALGHHLPAFMVRAGKLYLPWQMVLYLSSGLVAGVLVSLLTREVPREKIERFYALIRTPVEAGEAVETPCTLPAGAVVPPRRNLFGDSNLEIPVPTRTGVVGFLAGWAFVGGIVTVVYAIARM
jgi:Na+/proline symporter